MTILHESKRENEAKLWSYSATESRGLHEEGDEDDVQTGAKEVDDAREEIDRVGVDQVDCGRTKEGQDRLSTSRNGVHVTFKGNERKEYARAILVG